MQLAKNCIDVGLFTNRLDQMRAFYGERLKLRFEEMLPLGAGSRQYRYGLLGSVLKINHSREPAPERAAIGYRRLVIASRDISSPTDLADPEGTAVRLVPHGHGGVEQIAIELAVTNERDFHRFYSEGLGAEKIGERSYRLGQTVLTFSHDPKAQRADLGSSGDPAQVMLAMRAPGFRYMTIQVRNVDLEHARLVKLGFAEGSAPRTLGEVARISFIRDPDGNPIEISQRASLTGALPKD